MRAPLLSIEEDPVQQANFLKKAAAYHREIATSNDPSPTYKCGERELDGDGTSPGYFFPVLAADVTEANPTETFEGKCFNQISVEFEKTSETTFDVLLTLKDKKSLVCSDTLLFANTEIMHFEYLEVPGTHKISFEMTTPEA